MICIVDYGMGNLTSVAKALAFLGVRAKVTSKPSDLGRAKAVVFPGVGAFGEAMRELKRRRLISPLLDSIEEGKPFLGLCLGLQLLFERSEESPGVRGLGVFPGVVRRLPKRQGLKVPHMGWNQIQRTAYSVQRTGYRGQGTERVSLLKDVPNGAFMYFVHSFYARPNNKEMVSAMTDYGILFPAVIWNGENVWATQFHPEKSQRWGLQILKNFLKVVQQC